jgi:hypothetical protein
VHRESRPSKLGRLCPQPARINEHPLRLGAPRLHHRIHWCSTQWPVVHGRRKGDVHTVSPRPSSYAIERLESHLRRGASHRD